MQRTAERNKHAVATRPRVAVAALLLTVPLAATQVAAQPAGDSGFATIAVVADDACGSTGGASALADAIQPRMPDALVVVGDASDPSARVVWREANGECRVSVDAEGSHAELPLAASASQDQLAAAAARVAWLADDAWQRGVTGGAAAQAADPESAPGEASGDDTSDGSGEGSGELDLAVADAPVDDVAEGSGDAPPTVGDEPLEPDLTDVTFGFSVWDRLNLPRDSGAGARRHVSLTLLGSRVGAIDGVEFGLLYNLVVYDVHGAQFGQGANIVLGDLAGGAQFSAGANFVRGDTRGVQFAPMNATLGEVRGAQFGTINYAGSVRGVQASVVNVAAHDVHGVQLGIVNVAERSSASIGVINIMRREPVYALLWGESDGTFRAGIAHGSQHFRNILAAGINGFDDPTRWSAGFGFQGHVTFGRVFVDGDALGYAQGRIGERPSIVITENGADTTVALQRVDGLAQLRLSLGVEVAPRFAVYGGVIQNALFTDNPEHDQPTSNASPIQLGASADPTYLYLWPSFFAGLRF
ncbi:MAG: hypothetical protein H6700_12650 [Myxococcales bacterium]|nr:hypothetical protein [Myxococcales bacterium]